MDFIIFFRIEREVFMIENVREDTVTLLYIGNTLTNFMDHTCDISSKNIWIVPNEYSIILARGSPVSQISQFPTFGFVPKGPVQFQFRGGKSVDITSNGPTWIFQSTGFTAATAFLMRTSPASGLWSGAASTLRGFALASMIQAA